jgi:DNA-binding LacI/PurR family transcriptional regulator
MDRAERVSIRDVARAAGVSTTTVSDALSGRGRLPQATRDRVAKVALDLGYTANPSARWLRSGRTGAVGLYVPDRTVGLEYYMRLALGAADEAFTHGLALTLVPAWRQASPPPLQLDGVVVSDPVRGDPMLARLAALGVPIVTCERDMTPGVEHAARAQGDHRRGTRLLLDHLAEQGARRIALLCPGDETSFGADIRAAHSTWCAEHAFENLLYDVPFAASPPDVAAAVQRALAAPPGPDALVAVPDGSLAPALQALYGEGVRVPDDVLLASYVDSLALGSMPVPVTAVDLFPREMGHEATRLLADLVEGRAEAGQVVEVPVRLVVRQSTTPVSPGRDGRQAYDRDRATGPAYGGEQA